MAIRPRLSGETLGSISTPVRIESRIGVLEFNDGAPLAPTLEVLYDHLDFLRGVEAYLGTLPGASLAAVRRGFRSVGADDGAFLIFSDPVGSESLLLSADCDTILFWSFLDLADGPMVVDVPFIAPPSGIVGTIDDMWSRWVTDIGMSGPDRGAGGRYLIAGPDYGGPLPPGGFHVFQARTRRISVIGRAFMIEDDPTGVVEAIRDGVRVSSYVPGGHGTAVSTFLAGGAPLRTPRSAPPARFVEASGRTVNTIAPNDFGYWALVDELIQDEPPESGDPELLGLLASVGITHGKRFNPDPRMRMILDEALIVGIATARTVSFAPRHGEGFHFYPDSGWQNALFVGGHEFMDPPPRITAAGVVPSPTDGARKVNARTWFFSLATGVTPLMCMRIAGDGMQFLVAARDSNGEYLDGARRYRLTLPPEIPQSRSWSVVVYDRQTRSMLQTEQPKPSLGSRSGTVRANADGTTDIYFGPTAPDGKASNWLQTIPGRGWWTILRLHNPLQPFFDKTWKPSDIEPV